ncbi:MAG: hypothetical protein ACR2HI_06970 [Gaiella sp.]
MTWEDVVEFGLVLVRLERADPTLVRPVEDVWLERAPKRLVEHHLAARGG